MWSKKSFSQEVIKRLSLYLRNLKKLKEGNIDTISSHQITRFLNVSPAQFRKDLSYFGGFGKRGVGYEVKRLISELEKVLGVNKEWKIALVGAGKLGGALLEFKEFAKLNIKITCAFDNDRNKIGKVRGGVRIESIGALGKIIGREKIRIAIISTPPIVAQETADKLTAAGIRGILNFAPVILQVPGRGFVSNVDMASELESLIFWQKN